MMAFAHDLTSIDMSKEEQKKKAAEAAIDYIQVGDVIGVGTGSTANYFIDALAQIKHKIEGTVASSEVSAQRLRKHGIEVFDLNATGMLRLYVDGADESTKNRELIKGGGGALTREKIVAASSERFICVVDESKLVDVLGTFPLPVEVIPMARGMVARKVVSLGGIPELREGFVTDNGNVILDIHNLSILDPVKMEQEINNIPGVVTVGIFALRTADVLLIGTERGVDEI